jgi:hypothetical protein
MVCSCVHGNEQFGFIYGRQFLDKFFKVPALWSRINIETDTQENDIHGYMCCSLQDVRGVDKADAAISRPLRLLLLLRARTAGGPVSRGGGLYPNPCRSYLS